MLVHSFNGSLQGRYLSLFSCMLAVLLWGDGSFAGEGDDGLSFVNPEVSSSTNIHFSKHYCLECHVEEEGKLAMRFEDYIKTCRCHNYTPENYTHPVGIALSPEKRKNIPSNFPLLDNRTITCVTCHNLALQCREDSGSKKYNRAFLRVPPLPSRTAICYQCHNEVKYKMMDPHNQLDSVGRIVKEKCLYCHKKIPDVNASVATTNSDMSKGLENLVLPIGKLDALCYRCHYKQIKLHPINSNHLVKPSPGILRNMRRSERRLGVILPLDNKGRVTCVTCHNPHERGVIPAALTGAQGAGAVGRLRVSRRGDKICRACHQKS